MLQTGADESTARLVIRPIAFNDLESLAAHIARDSLSSAEAFVQQTMAGLGDLRRYPEAGARLELDAPELKHIRKWNVPGFRNHLIFYRLTSETVEVLRVLHGSRDLPAAMRDTDDY